MWDVQEANRAFYAAHEAGDVRAMFELWEHSARVVCVHPGWPILRGWQAVGASWQRILTGPVQTHFIITNESVVLESDTAWVTCDENLMSLEHAGTVAAINVFSRTEGGWRMVAHHGSHVLQM